MADIREDNKMFAVTRSTTAIGTTELMVLLLKVPNTSGFFAQLRNIVITNTHTVANSWVRVRMYIAPTITSDGTALTEVPLDFGGGDTADLTAFGTPTISANGTQFFDMTVIAGQSQTFYFPPGVNLRANQNVLITAVADSTSRVSQITVQWEE